MTREEQAKLRRTAMLDQQSAELGDGEHVSLSHRELKLLFSFAEIGAHYFVASREMDLPADMVEEGRKLADELYFYVPHGSTEKHVNRMVFCGISTIFASGKFGEFSLLREKESGQ